MDAAARRVHLLVPERVGRARRQAEPAVDAVGDQLGLHSASTTRSASGLQRCSRRRPSGDRRRRGAGPDERAPAPPSQRTRRREARPAARAPRPTASARLAAECLATCASTARSPPFEEDVHAAVRPRSTALGARPERVQLAPARRQSVDDRALRRGQRVQAQRDPLDAPEPAARAAEELAEVVAGDVLHDLAARVRARAVGERDRDADHEVAHRAEAMPQRAGEVVEQALAERRVAGRVERAAAGRAAAEQPLCSADSRRPPLDDAGQVARLVLEDRVELTLERSASPASSSGCARYGPGTSPQSRGVGKSLPGFARPSGSNARAQPLHRRRGRPR